MDAALEAGLDATLDAVPSPPDARNYEAAASVPTARTRAYCLRGDSDAVETRITAVLSTLTADEKIGLLSGASVTPVNGTWRVRGTDNAGVPGFHMLDGPRGVSRFSQRNATAFPVAMLRGATWDPALERRVGEAIADEAKSLGADVILAPTVNLLRHPRWGRAQETYSEDTHHMGAMAVSFVQGLQSHGVMASVKHFAGNSIEATRHSVDVQMDERTLREVYLPHFRRVVTEANAATVMSAYNRLRGAWCDQNGPLLTDILRGEWDFQGPVMSDWIQGTHGDVVSLRAGLDLEMPVGVNYPRLRGALARGDLREEEVDRSARRVLRAQFCYGLTPRPEGRVDVAGQRETEATLALAREVAARGIVLLKNERPAGAAMTAPPILPLVAGSLRRVVVAGRNADVVNIGDQGSSSVTPTRGVTALAGLRTRLGAGVTVTHVTGPTLTAQDQTAVRDADAVLIVTGLQSSEEGEGEIGGGDRANLLLPAAEATLIANLADLNPRLVVIVESGAAIVPGAWDARAAAVLWAGYPGSEGGTAIAALLVGDVEPAGRLPFSVPAAESELPPFDNTSATVTYGYLHGYRYLDAMGTTPRYAFGHGLAYTAFAYGTPTLTQSTVRTGETLQVSLDVTNTGSRAGYETVQAYVAQTSPTVMRAPQDLRAFEQVRVDAGATVRVTLTVRADDLAVWDATAHRWTLPAGDYALRLGASAGDVRQRVGFRVVE